MENRSTELLELEHKDPSFLQESKLLVCGESKKVTEKRPISDGQPFIAPLPKSQVLGKVKDFLGVISEANKTLQHNAKDNPQEFDIEVLDGNESKYIEMDLMLGVADLHTPEAMAAAQAVIAGNQPILDLVNNDSSSDSSSDDDNDDDDDEDENEKVDTPAGPTPMQEDGSLRQQSESRSKRKRPKIVELP